MKDAFFRMSFSVMFVLAGIAVLFPEVYAGIFTGEGELSDLTASVMPVYFLGITIFGIQTACQTTFVALGQALVSVFIALLRKVMLLIPLALILPRFMGVMGIYRAEPIADITSVTATAIIFTVTFKKILRNMDKNDMIDASDNREG